MFSVTVALFKLLEIDLSLAKLVSQGQINPDYAKLSCKPIIHP